MKSTDMPDITPDSIRETAIAFQRSRILLTAFELGVFSALGDTEKTAEETALALGVDPQAAGRLMNALCALGYLEKNGARYANTPSGRDYLVEGSPDYQAGLGHLANLWKSWSTLTEAVRKGRPIIEQPLQERGDEWFRSFIAAMHDRAKKQAVVVADMLGLSGVGRLLDVGGGSGAFSIAFVRKEAGLHATVFDLPRVTILAREYVEREGLASRIDTRDGDYTRDDLGGGYDLVFLSAIVHSNSFEENRSLVAQCAAALKRGGRLAILDFVMDEDRTSPVMGAIFSLNMLVDTKSGDTYTESEIKGWMQSAGIEEINRTDTPFGSSLLIGRRS